VQDHATSETASATSVQDRAVGEPESLKSVLPGLTSDIESLTSETNGHTSEEKVSLVRAQVSLVSKLCHSRGSPRAARPGVRLLFKVLGRAKA
jgi:hypothetical protein